jgi:deoxyadenosine kinase
MNLPVYYEPVLDNAYLADFYRDKTRYAFPLQVGLLGPDKLTVQVYLLNRRFQQHQQIIWSGKGGVQDRTIYEDTVFAKVCESVFFHANAC